MRTKDVTPAVAALRRDLAQVNSALREAEFGNAAPAKQDVAAALAVSPGRDV
ncbi:MAG: hypothetical protein ABSE28_07780 [Candidatus Sulfotelmatobacter sp.]